MISGVIGVGQTHRAEVFLPLDYPRQPPFCRMLTPVFHPNIDPAKICIGDHWSAGQSLAQLVCRIGEMLDRRPEEVIRKAVKGMLPRNRLARQQLTKLKVYAGPDHPHEAQQPKPMEIQT